MLRNETRCGWTRSLDIGHRDDAPVREAKGPAQGRDRFDPEAIRLDRLHFCHGQMALVTSWSLVDGVVAGAGTGLVAMRMSTSWKWFHIGKLAPRDPFRWRKSRRSFAASTS